jgi:hypothetical protein
MAIIGHCFNFGYLDMMEMDINDFMFFENEASKVLGE